eukprot:Nk52_evm35s223 gene=Nk52_evmTU35s223
MGVSSNRSVPNSTVDSEDFDNTSDADLSKNGSANLVKSSSNSVNNTASVANISFPWRKTHSHYESYKARTQKEATDRAVLAHRTGGHDGQFGKGVKQVKSVFSVLSYYLGGCFCEYVVQPQALKLISEGDLESFGKLLDVCGNSPVHSRYAGYTLLHYVGLFKYNGRSAEFAKLLLERGANINAKKSFSLICPFFYVRNIDTVIYERGEHTNSVRGYVGQHQCTHIDSIKSIPKVHFFSMNLWTTFLKQVTFAVVFLVVYLIPVFGWYLWYEINISNMYETPLHAAANHFDVGLILFLCQYYESISKAPKDGITKYVNSKRMDKLTPLHLAIRCLNEDATFVLLRYGADPLFGDSKKRISKQGREFVARQLVYGNHCCPDKSLFSFYMCPLEYVHSLLRASLPSKTKGAVRGLKNGDCEKVFDLIKSFNESFFEKDGDLIVKPSKEKIEEFMELYTGLRMGNSSYSLATIDFMLLLYIFKPFVFHNINKGCSNVGSDSNVNEYSSSVEIEHSRATLI